MEEKLEEVFDKHWKGFMTWEDLTKDDKRRFTKEYTAEEFYDALKAAYNLGIEVAADNATATILGEYNYPLIDKESILNLQIE